MQQLHLQMELWSSSASSAAVAHSTTEKKTIAQDAHCLPDIPSVQQSRGDLIMGISCPMLFYGIVLGASVSYLQEMLCVAYITRVFSYLA